MKMEVEVAIPPPIPGKQQKCVGNVFSCSSIAGEKKLICVTSGNSYLGSSIVKELLSHVELGELKDLIGEEEFNLLESVVLTKMGDLQSLCDAFRGCHAVFHTSSFIDPHGISGYSEQMVFVETEVARTVVEACARAAYVKRCVFTSSLIASIWRNGNMDGVIEESCWSSEEFCRENKTKAEKVAWMKAKELKVNLVTVCPGLLMAPTFPNALPYLKGGQTMLQQGCLAIAEVKKVAKAHVKVYEGMDYGACGRYFCFDGVVRRLEEAIELENGLKIAGLLLGDVVLSDEEIPIKISNSKLAALLDKASQRGRLPMVHKISCSCMLCFASYAWFSSRYKAWGSLVGLQLAERDIIVACIDYRNFPQGTISDKVKDASQGVSFVCNLIGRYGVDPNSQRGHIFLLVFFWSRQSKNLEEKTPPGVSPKSKLILVYLEGCMTVSLKWL
ncbi:putative endo-1,3(4)-beta-glucanase 2-like [Hibiscus syriacus]|uniref:Endo-1,3(4)-beta-glucanase 2-like n=1 Tax=Hibiscus syriacus TaxID=106335 RepID=A0A6A3BF17_HIBSY|nr:putative endo-1,3(4)-beta-glucanase 2-like [Hibiscus syriacus]